MPGRSDAELAERTSATRSALVVDAPLATASARGLVLVARNAADPGDRVPNPFAATPS